MPSYLTTCYSINYTLEKYFTYSYLKKSLLTAGFLLIVMIMCLPVATVQAQEKCAVVAYQKILKTKFPKLEGTSGFEQWMKKKLQQKYEEGTKYSRQEAEVIQIPVVVHIIHGANEAEGVGKNLAKAQIESQITVLNEDFRRLNDDASNTPAVFQPVAADIEIEFVLAKRDPEGLPTDGIVRVVGEKSQYGLVDQYEMKALSNWPSDEYLNIWVTDLANDFLGYAQFPVSSLEGLEDASNHALTDGVVIDYRAFGSEALYPPADLINAYSLGRTTTHEVGHYLGLRHIWGDSNQCSVDDFCEDTPRTNIDHGGLSTCDFPTSNNGCGSDDMFQNYMDYTDDKCMNLFTLDQKARMRTVMDNSPRRASLKDSRGDELPVIVNNDLGIRTILTPGSSNCDLTIAPAIEVRNYGSNAISSASVAVRLNGVTQETLTYSLNLDYLDRDTL
ncbi:MAG: zinc metalloprotease, partial [Fulvivirga sp.]|nr:zinc metalloprotease [Fulvivirga sp.]